MYERLLVLYPKVHRHEYGSAMVQLFRDQCRDAWSQERGWGLGRLWLRTAIDLAETSVAEHLRNLRERGVMLSNMLFAFRTDPAARKTFLVLFTAVFVLVVGACGLLTFLAPEVYASTARVKVERGANDKTPPSYERYVQGGYDPYFVKTQSELIKSDAVLGPIAKKLALAESWGTAFAGGARLSDTDAISMLRGRFDLRPARNTSLIEIRAFSQNPSEAAEIANALAEGYREIRSEPSRGTGDAEQPGVRSIVRQDPLTIVDRAVPGLRPVRPNKPFNLFLGLFGGLFTASLVASAGVLLVLVYRRFSQPKASAA